MFFCPSFFVAFFLKKCYIVVKKTTEKIYDNKTL